MSAETERDWTRFALVALLALGLRLHGLATLPLAPDEATDAATAWVLSEASPPFDGTGAPSVLPTSPLLASGDWLLFVLGAAGDAASRLPTALFGAALALVPFFVRREMGGSTALALAVLLAADPVLLAHGRHADGAAASAFFAGLALVALFRSRDPESARETVVRWKTLAAASVGLLVATGAQAWSFLPLVAAARFMAGHGSDDADRMKQAGVTLGAAALGASAFLRSPEMIGGVSASLGRWLRQWDRAGAAGGPIARLTSLARTEALVLALALTGVLALWVAGRRRLAAALTFGLAWGLWLAIAPSALFSSRIVIALAAAVAAAWGAAWVWEWLRNDRIAALLVAAALLAITGSLVLRTDATRHGEKISSAGPALLAAGVAALVLGARSVRRPRAILRGTALWLIAGLAMLTFRHAGRIVRGDAPAGLSPSGSSADVRRLVGDLKQIGAARNGDPRDIPLQVIGPAESDPVLAWSLRELRRVRFVSSLEGDGRARDAVLVVPENGDAPTGNPPAGYVGTRYVLRDGRPDGALAVALWVPSEP